MKYRLLTSTIVGAGLILAACSSEPNAKPNQNNSSSPSSATAASGPKETADPQARLIAAYDGGILTLDAKSLEIINDTKLNDFSRLNPLGDDRHVLISTKEGFQIFDTGVWTEPHGDHSHSYVQDPKLTEHVYKAQKPGHVTSHEGRTLLFSDEDGRIQDISLSDVARASQRDGFAKPEQVIEVTPHHGVAVALPEGGMVHTEGTKDERHSVIAINKDGAETARTNDCPGVHGEGAAKDDAISFGCENGTVVYQNGKFKKISSPDSYGRIGTQIGSEKSAIILGDYRTKKGNKKEKPKRVSLINTKSDEIKLVDLPASYTPRSLGRGSAGEALVLGTDGNLHVIDPDSGKVTGSHKIIDEWEIPEKRQEARPTLFVLDNTAYVTDPKAKKLHAVDIDSGKVTKSVELPSVPTELKGVAG